MLYTCKSYPYFYFVPKIMNDIVVCSWLEFCVALFTTMWQTDTFTAN